MPEIDFSAVTIADMIEIGVSQLLENIPEDEKIPFVRELLAENIAGCKMATDAITSLTILISTLEKLQDAADIESAIDIQGRIVTATKQLHSIKDSQDFLVRHTAALNKHLPPTH